VRVEAVDFPLDHDLSTVRKARRFVAEAVTRAGFPDLVADARLIASELVTNSLLHASEAVSLRVEPLAGGVRLEVRDSSASMPVRLGPGADSMTGRGLILIDTVSHRWGVDRLTDGKSVWCELLRDDHRTASEIPADDPRLAGEADLEMVHGPDGSDSLFTVQLGDVPTDLLIAAKAHVDNLVREFTLAASGARTGHSGAVPPGLASLIETVVHRFASPRESIKRQAVHALRRGDERTRLTLRLPVSAADAGEAYLAALDDADDYARAARLLTMETPLAHKVFRRWYVESLISQLRAAAAGRQVVQESLESRLIDELGHVAAAHRLSVRAARLQSVTAAIAGAQTAEGVAKVVVSEGVAALGASGGALLMSEQSGAIDVPGAVGYGDDLLDRFAVQGISADLPAAAAMRTAEEVWVETRADRDVRFPLLAGFEPDTVSICALPLVVGPEVRGALRFSFDVPRLFDEDERSFVRALAAQTAQALERTLLYDKERAARAAAEAMVDRLRRLQVVTNELAGARDPEQAADIVVNHAADAIGANLAAISLLEGDHLGVVRITGARADAPARWRMTRIDDALPASEAVRTASMVVVRNRQELVGKYPLLAAEATEDRAYICLPLSVGQRCLGVLTLSFPQDRDVEDTGELRFLTLLADGCAQAIARSEAMIEARAATDKLSFLAEASAELSSSLDYRPTLANLARLVVPRLADWCTIHLLDDDGEFEPVAVAHVNPDKVAGALEYQRRYPVNRASTSGIPEVVRTGRSEMYPLVTDEMIAAADVDEDYRRYTRELGLTSVLIVPLTGRSGTFGAISMVHAESGRQYDEGDRALAEDLARRAAIAVENARLFRQQTGRLAAITRVAEAAQQAILAPVPSRVGPVSLEAAYVSASKEALIGGDLYEVVRRGDAVRLLIGDVRGKGLDAVRMATVVLGEFRSAAMDNDDLGVVARQIDRRLQLYLGDEDFVTAAIAEIRDDGQCTVLCCGHPPVLIADAGVIREFGNADSVPLGLGVTPMPAVTMLTPGARVLLYTDGLLEARDAGRRFPDLAKLAQPLASADHRTVLDRILAELRRFVGRDLEDDLALLVAEYRP
jgi:GAF domain-containing protein/anti-sigma regulatory factor (Ser/Thr protein kinase)